MTISGRGYAGGTFDLFHAGHVDFLRKCKSYCEYLVVAMNTDEFASRYKRKPIMTLPERKIVVQACKYVDDVIINAHGEDSRPAIYRAGAEVIFHGDDWTGDSFLDQLGVSQEWLDELEIDVQYVPYSPIVSTSEVIERVLVQRNRH